MYKCCVGFASLDAVCDELNDCVWYLDLLQLSDKWVYVYCVESFAHIECYSDCSGKVSHMMVEMFITIVSISIRLVVIYWMSLTKEQIKTWTHLLLNFRIILKKKSCLRGNRIIFGDF